MFLLVGRRNEQKMKMMKNSLFYYFKSTLTSFKNERFFNTYEELFPVDSSVSIFVQSVEDASHICPFQLQTYIL